MKDGFFYFIQLSNNMHLFHTMHELAHQFAQIGARESINKTFGGHIIYIHTFVHCIAFDIVICFERNIKAIDYLM